MYKKCVLLFLLLQGVYSYSQASGSKYSDVPQMACGSHQTIPEMVARGQGVSSAFGCGIPPHKPGEFMERFLRDTDVIVVARLGKAHSYLSKDQCEVYTDFVLDGAVLVYRRNGPQAIAEKEGDEPAPFVLTQLGGRVLVGGTEYTQSEAMLPLFQSGMFGLFLLHDRDGKHFITATYYGAFSIKDNKLVPLERLSYLAPEYSGLEVEEGISKMLKTLNTVPRDVDKAKSVRAPQEGK